ncbi:hypothetical protein AB0F96_35405 [Streptomyces sp. NPDC023998]
MSSATRRFGGYGVLITGTTLRVDGGLLAVNTAFMRAAEGD